MSLRSSIETRLVAHGCSRRAAGSLLELFEEELAYARNEAYDEARRSIAKTIEEDEAPCYRGQGCAHEYCAGLWAAQDIALEGLD